METLPPVGMKYEQVRKRLVNYKSVKENPYLRDSLIRQAALHEGEGAAKELAGEYYDRSHSGNTVAYNPHYEKRYDEINWNSSGLTINSGDSGIVKP